MDPTCTNETKELSYDFDTEAHEGIWKPKAHEQSANEKLREQRAGSLPPPTPKAILGASQHTSRKRNKVNKDLPEGLLGSGGDGLPKKPKGKKTSGGSDPDDSSDNSDSDPRDNEGQLPKVKIISQKLLVKYISTMIKDQ